jgi:hypothetical protein
LLAELHSQGATVTAPEILGRLSMSATLRGDRMTEFPLLDNGEQGDGAAKDGLFGARFSAPATFGSHDLEIIARAPTIERRKIVSLHVVDRWFEIQVEKEVVAPGGLVPLKVAFDPRGLGERDLRPEFVATALGPDGRRVSLEVPPLLRNLHAVSLDETQVMGVYRVTVTGILRDAKGALVAEDTIGPISFLVKGESAAPLLPPVDHGHEAPTPTPAETAHATPTPAHADHAPTPTPTPDAAAPVVESTKTGFSNSLYVQIGILTALLLICGMLGFLVFRRRSGEVEAQSMASLRKRASEIREENYETPNRKTRPPAPPPSVPPLEREPAETPETPGGEPAAPRGKLSGPPEQTEELVAPKKQRAVPNDPDLIPPPVVEAEEAPPSAATEDTPAGRVGDGMSGAEQNLLAEILGETGNGDAEPEESETPEMEEAVAATALSDDEADLLSEILNEPVGAKDSQGAAEAAQAENDDVLSNAEEDLLAENMGETKSGDKKAGGTPAIPSAPDGKSDKDAIDDILKQIEGLME